MRYEHMLKKLDHTCLSPTAKWEDIKSVCEDGLRNNVATVCIPPAYVNQARECFGRKIKISTVVGFPNGYSVTSVKIKEIEEMIKLGASEIDMVINLGFVKDKKYNRIFDEIRFAKDVLENKVLKVIVETCLLDNQEKIKLCEIITESGADFIKTSTGFSHRGAEIDDIILFKKYLGNNIKIKASGGINSIEKAREFFDLGVERIGSSNLLDLVVTKMKKITFGDDE
ncbi:MAG: deoxyribose-phosphate aldolase [Oscillospiraceae bacterium]|nr:deoxyribose-phosphate aldolase [Oscillospiraceae bacterium]